MFVGYSNLFTNSVCFVCCLFCVVCVCERERYIRMTYHIPNPSSLFSAIKPKAEKCFRTAAMLIFYRNKRCPLSQGLLGYCPSAVATGLRHRQLVTLTVTSSLEGYWVLFQHTSGIHSLVGKLNILTRDFSSLRLATHGMKYCDSQSKLNLLCIISWHKFSGPCGIPASEVRAIICDFILK